MENTGEVELLLSRMPGDLEGDSFATDLGSLVCVLAKYGYDCRVTCDDCGNWFLTCTSRGNA